jgi:hypothetical protein
VQLTVNVDLQQGWQQQPDPDVSAAGSPSEGECDVLTSRTYNLAD